MTFGTELLDKQVEIEEFGQLGNEAIFRLADYLRRRATLSEDYARSLQKLNRQFTPALSHEVGMDDLLGSTEAIVTAHLLLVEQVQNSLLEGMKLTAREHDRTRREVTNEIRSLRNDWRKTLCTFEKIRKARDVAVKAAEEARISFEKANNDRNVTKAYVEKLRDEYALKARRTLVCKEEYIQAAHSIKQEQKKHYDEDLPTLFDKLQKVEETRLLKTKLHLSEFGNLAAGAVNEELTSFKVMLTKWERFTPTTFIQSFIDRIREGSPFKYPEVVILDEGALTEALGLSAGGGSISNGNLKRSTTQLCKKSSSINNLLLLNPEAIQIRLEDLEKEISLLTKQKEGARILHELYKTQSQLADDKTKIEAARQFEDLTLKLDELYIEKGQLYTKLSSNPNTNNNKEEEDEGGVQEQVQEQEKGEMTTPPSIRSQTSLQSPVLWDEEEDGVKEGLETTTLQSPTPGEPDSCLTAIETSKVDHHQLKPTVSKLSALFQAQALFDFEATDSQQELSLKTGDLITIYSCEGEWWQAESIDGRSGYVPHNYVRQLEL